MGRKWQLIAALVLVLGVTSGLYAFTYISATATMDVTVAGTEIASVQDAAAQPDWDSILAAVPYTETLRPSGVGSTTQLAPKPGAGEANWEDVDDANPDEDNTRVQKGNTNWRRDTYATQDHSEGFETIAGVRVYFRCRENDVATDGHARAVIRTHDTDYEGSDNSLTPSYQDYSYQWTINPFTEEAWTWDEIDAMEIGVDVRRNDTSGNCRCTQVYVEVSYHATILLYSDVPTGDLFEITPDNDYTGDFAVKVYLTNTGSLVKAYSYLNMKVYLEGSVEAGETPDYLLLTLEDGGVTFNMKNYAPGTYTLSVAGGSYCLVSTDSSEWEAGWTVTPEFYCKIVQRTE